MTHVASLADARLRRQAAQGVEAWLSKQQIAQHLGFSTRWVEYRVTEGMPCMVMGGVLRFRVTEVHAWLQGRAEPRSAS